MIQIYRNINGAETRTIQISDLNAIHKSEIMGADEVQVSVVVDSVLNIQQGDYIKYNGIEYVLNRAAEYTKVSDVEFDYALVFEHPLYRLLDKLYMHQTTRATTFWLTGRLRDFVELLVWNVNKSASNPLGIDTGWTVGNVEHTDFRNVFISDASCRDVLNILADEFDCEFFLDNKRINFTDKVRRITDYTFEQGREKGLYTITHQNVDREDTVTRAFIRGGNQNVPNDYVDEEGFLKLPENFLENFEEHSTVVERKVRFDDEFPHFVGSVTTVSGANNYRITCPAINFNLREIAVGDNARINFLTGDLMGQSFKFDWHNPTREIRLIRQDDELSLPDADGNRPQIPSELRFARIGDQFNFTGVWMPKEYVDASIERLREKGKRWLEFHSRKRVKYEIAIDHRFLRGKKALKVGDVVTIIVTEKNEKIFHRIISVDENLRTGALTATVSNYLDEKWERRIEGAIAQLQTTVVSGGGVGGSTSIEVLEELDNRVPSNRNVFSSLRSRREALSRLFPDTAQQLITFLRGANFGTFIPSISTGTGGGIDEKGNAELQSLILRSFLKVPNLIFNHVHVTGGEMWNTEGAVIASVTADSENAYILGLEIEDGDRIGLQVDDICKGHYNQSGGFVTTYFRVTHVNDTNKTIRIVLGADGEVPGGANHAPVPYMNIARYGNFTVRARQRSQYLSSNNGTITLLDLVDNFIIEPRHHVAVIGNVPPSLLPDNLPIREGDASIFLKNVIASNFFQIDHRGNPIRVIRDRGLWEANPDEPYANTPTLQDEVWHISCKWRCIVNETTQEPAYNSTDWLLVAGDTSLSLTIDSSNGTSFLFGHIDTTLTATVRRGVNDITADIAPIDWKWTRTTNDVASDTIWNIAHAGSTDSVHLTDSDMNGMSGIFQCEVYIREGRVTLTESISFS